ncbi:MAG: DUF1987 domain-containing protein [Candidatus Magnetominusculus sp. LBB02]|nr:DUF1987 domain-containing protein [Candidatus Magnetominusculus sp. LBB02]
MEKYSAAATKSTPYVMFDPAIALFVIRGESYPENAASFFSPVFDWLTEFLKHPYDRAIVFDIELIYFNSSSSKANLKLLTMLEDASKSGKDITVNWRYYADNDTAHEAGEEYKEDVPHLKFNVVEVERPK